MNTGTENEHITPNVDNRVIGRGFYPAFAQNERELLENLLKYWITQVLDSQRHFGSTQRQQAHMSRNVQAYGNQRLNHIAEIIGEEPVEKDQFCRSGERLSPSHG